MKILPLLMMNTYKAPKEEMALWHAGGGGRGSSTLSVLKVLTIRLIRGWDKFSRSKMTPEDVVAACEGEPWRKKPGDAPLPLYEHLPWESRIGIWMTVVKHRILTTY